MDSAKKLHKELRTQAAKSLREARKFKGMSDLSSWYNGRYRAFKHSAAMLEIAIRYDASRGTE